MEPRIQYAKTSDGVNIAFWVLGEGTPVVETPFGFSHIQLEWQLPEFRRFYQRLADKRKLIRYDSRGNGLSDREVTDFSLNAHVLDIEAVVERPGLGTFALMGVLDGGSPAIAYAASHPDRVSHLILWCTYARVSDYWASSPQVQAINALRDEDWEVFTETMANLAFGWSAGEQARRFAAFMRECITPEAYRLEAGAWGQFDVTPLLPNVRVPTLVIHRREVPYLPLDHARRLAAHIPAARLVVLEGTTVAPWTDLELVLATIDEFLAEGAAEAKAEPPELPSGTAVILFADIVDSTALTERLGDAAFRAKARDLDGSLRAAIAEHAGTAVEGKLLGDGVLAVFTSARQAIEAALRCASAGDDCDLPLHLGIHAGDVIREGNNVYGGAVNIAARISALSGPGEVLVSDTVRGLARTSAGVTFEGRGEQALKGVAEPQRLFAVRPLNAGS